MTTQTSESAKKYWLYFGISTVAILAFLVIKPEWFWLALPFFCVYFVKAMDWI